MKSASALRDRQLAGRPLEMWARELRSTRNYRALWRAFRLTAEPLENARRYLLGSGDYPYRPSVRTPLGVYRPSLYSFADMLTFNEVFLREDYRCPAEARVVVDIGSNIGLSALYFLTRNPQLRCWLYEPLPTNVSRLRTNLSGFEGRYELAEVAVGSQTGDVEFGFEASGRYGGIGVATGQTVTVPCVDVNSVLSSVLERTGHIDVLKVDTEGLETTILRAIDDSYLNAIQTIIFEWQGEVSVFPDRFESSYYNETYRLERR